MRGAALRTVKIWRASIIVLRGAYLMVGNANSNGWERKYENGIVRIGHGGGIRTHLFHYIPDANPNDTITIIFLSNGSETLFDHRAFGDMMAAIMMN